MSQFIRDHPTVAVVIVVLTIGLLAGVAVAKPLGIHTSSDDSDASQCQKPSDPNGSIEPLRLRVLNQSESGDAPERITVEVFRLDGTQYCERSVRVADESRIVPLVWQRGEYHLVVRSDDGRASTDIRQVSSTRTLESLVVSEDRFSMWKVRRMNATG